MIFLYNELFFAHDELAQVIPLTFYRLFVRSDRAFLQLESGNDRSARPV